MSTPDLQIVDRLRRGDATVMEAVYDGYADALYGIISRIVRDEDIADDLLQETFVRVWTQRDRFDATKGSFFTWMLNIARNLSIDTIRSSAYRQGAQNRTVDELVGFDEPTSDDRIVPEAADLRDHVQTLSPDQRAVVDLMYFQGYTQSEIAESFNIPLGTVKSRLRLAMNALRTIYGHAT